MAPAAFALLCGVLVGAAGVPWREGAAAALAVALAFATTGWLAPAGWRRRLAELALVPVGFAFTLLADPTQRAMAMPPLLSLAALAAFAAARRRTPAPAEPLLTAALSLSMVSACGLGLVGFTWWPIALAVLAPVALTAAATLAAGLEVGVAAALLTAALPWVRWPVPAGIVLAISLAALVALRFSWVRTADHGSLAPGWPARVARGWLPAALGLALLASALAPWGGLAPWRAFPHASWLALGLGLAALAVTPVIPPAAAGATWLAVALTLGPPQPAPPEGTAVTLTAASPRAQLAATASSPYVLDVSLANSGLLKDGTEVATVRQGPQVLVLRAGEAAVEWAHERREVHAAHRLPDEVVWRPAGMGRWASWSVAARTVVPAAEGAAPVIERAAGLPAATSIAVAAGPARATPPRDWTLPAFLLAGALLVAALQLAAATHFERGAALPWAILAAGALAARLPVAPLRLLAERHAVDLALAACLAAWVPAAWRWLRQGRPFITAATILLPLALLTPHLTPPMHGDEPFHLAMLEALTSHHTLELAQSSGFSGQLARLYTPALAVLLSPGYLLAGRAGALALLALAGAACVALLWRHAGALGLAGPRRSLLTLALLLTYPLATFCTQIWVEVLGALAAVATLALAMRRPAGRGWATLAMGVAVAVKTRLALVTIPQAVVAWWPAPGRRRAFLVGLAALAGAVALGGGVAWLYQGHPFGPYRRLHDLLPHGVRQPLLVLGGLLFDPAGGILFAAPLALLALAGAGRLWRRGEPAERALLLGGPLTVLALLHSHEWYGGGSPPARYLVPLLPAAVLAGAMLLKAPGTWRRLAWLAFPPSLLLAWTLVARPQLSINPGQGAWWLSSALARRLQADTWTCFPSFLRLTTATWRVPGVLVLLAAVLLVVAWQKPAVGRSIARLAVPIWLVAAAGLLFAVHARLDRVVELEAAQVIRRGGTPVPPEGTFSSFTYRNGWRLRDGNGMTVPLHLGPGATVSAEGWVEGTGLTATLLAAWDGSEPASYLLSGGGSGALPLAPPPGPGRHTLRLDLQAPPGLGVVLDRLVVTP
jgi:hypothetical protein